MLLQIFLERKKKFRSRSRTVFNFPARIDKHFFAAFRSKITFCFLEHDKMFSFNSDTKELVQKEDLGMNPSPVRVTKTSIFTLEDGTVKQQLLQKFGKCTSFGSKSKRTSEMPAKSAERIVDLQLEG